MEKVKSYTLSKARKELENLIKIYFAVFPDCKKDVAVKIKDLKIQIKEML
jgi:hypothetical protein